MSSLGCHLTMHVITICSSLCSAGKTALLSKTLRRTPVSHIRCELCHASRDAQMLRPWQELVCLDLAHKWQSPHMSFEDKDPAQDALDNGRLSDLQPTGVCSGLQHGQRQ